MYLPQYRCLSNMPWCLLQTLLPAVLHIIITLWLFLLFSYFFVPFLLVNLLRLHFLVLAVFSCEDRYPTQILAVKKTTVLFFNEETIIGLIKKNSGIAIGNVIGSSLFNIFFVLGCSASISPLPMGGINNVDMAVLVGSAILFWLVGWFFKKRTITRVEGALMVICYVAYTAFLISQQ